MNGLIDYFMQAELGMQIAIGVALLLVCLLLFKVLKKLFSSSSSLLFSLWVTRFILANLRNKVLRNYSRKARVR